MQYLNRHGYFLQMIHLLREGLLALAALQKSAEGKNVKKNR